MSNTFKVNTIAAWLYLAFPMVVIPLYAAEPYPALPPTLSTSVDPNVMLLIDNSGSMLQDGSNNWITQSSNSSCNQTNEIWTGCIGNSTYRNWIDSESSNPNTKMNIAKKVARSLITNNPKLRWGLASFRVNDTTTVGGSERGESAKIVTPIGSSIGTSTDSSTATVLGGINSLRARTATPLGEALLEITQYYQGKASLYGLISENYTSPIQYRCQKNFTIVITDGDATNDDNLPGSGKSAISYTSIDAANNSVNKSFSVCTAVSSPDCPAALEGSSGTPGFGDTTNRPRAIRDVAKYANDLDMRTSGNDLDGKSFDDTKFKKQNMQTYTVGFSVLNDVLPATASVGGGKYYTATDETTLSTALTNAVNEIIASISNAGGVATQTETYTAGNKVFQPVFNPKGWYGELRCYNLDSYGNFDPVTSKCTPNAKAVFPAVASRKIYSSTNPTSTSTSTSSGTTAFSFDTSTGLTAMSTTQKTALGATATDQQNIINYIRGTDGTFRSRTNGLLGDIVDSQPIVVSKPAGESTDTDYATFKTANASRSMVFIGANDGMMHGFDINNMTEILGYIPATLYSKLPNLSKTDYGENTTPHNFYVNGSMRQADIKAGGSWKTILVGGLGQGGKAYYAIDATQASNFSSASATVKWERNNLNSPSIGYTLPAPIIYNVRTSSSTVVPAVILANGYENNWGVTPVTANTSSLLIVNANTGDLIKEITVPNSTGLSSPAGADFGQDGILDYVYAGDMSGKLWRFDLTDNNPNNFKVAPNPIYDAGTTKPIAMRPAVMALNKTNGDAIGNLIFFGTGKLLTDTDRTNTDQQTFYAVIDKMVDTPVTVTQSDLQVQTVIDTKSTTSNRIGNYRKVSNNSLDLQSATNTKLGWYIDFPISSEKLVTSPMLYDDKLIFGTGVPLATEKCIPGGKGWIMGLNPLTGSVTTNKKGNKYSFIDINSDNKATAADQISFTTGAEYMSGYEKSGIPTELSYVSSENKIITPTNSDTSLGAIGSVIAQRESNYAAVYIGNAKAGVKSGVPQPKPASTGKGSLYGGTIGSDTVDKETLLSPSTGVKVEISTWREIK
ncbi:hypothetical protein HQ393_13640 [Chitinibacter bivalviorum]|uniref:PilY1 beta-propeller domain-containing protein n=1 Tax=Chitinibacter bivalviorum TaxID=2739434 RepID=A0A7H9BLC9_9NEIS|nr:PilC/PilY family type IV pilus protein [Chitinibacter bivalviorum]QLG89202.1 hypothetical protein HQ393_13640 [Chitinibacter bivalviorum]